MKSSSGQEMQRNAERLETGSAERWETQGVHISKKFIEVKRNKERSIEDGQSLKFICTPAEASYPYYLFSIRMVHVKRRD